MTRYGVFVEVEVSVDAATEQDALDTAEGLVQRAITQHAAACDAVSHVSAPGPAMEQLA